ncbi:LPS export ABC transporter permease LptG [Rubrimonas cliftonensis]|uniref:Lipopolysaccharide export system permease protein n=1 Tax=Rubrimonas cliftonensis TaxID=89524 RepID=A0A1H3VZX6_9RHOB|nr:LPS export ABC transporter permease LptG [Rubrimonas cliftonensis]SDZ80347.1 lipopolysaccharide export system permease protein [Rubrimonas cliftonensis]
MSWTLTRYIGARFVSTLGLVFLTACLVVFLGNLIELLREAGEAGGVGFARVAAIAALKAPTIALVALPFMVMLAALACYARLARSSELVVTRAAGVSAWAALAPAVLVAFATGFLSVTLFNPLAAATASRAETLEARSFDGRTGRISVSAEGLWLRQGGGAEPGGQTVVHARSANADATELRHVTLFSFNRDGDLVGRINAKNARLSPGAWLLTDALTRRLDEREATADADTLPAPETDDASALEVDGPRAPPERFDPSLEVPTELTREQILESFEKPEAISFWALPGFIRTLEDAGFSALRHRLHWQAQLASPLLFAGMCMVGASFAMRHHRQGGLGFMALGAVLAGFGFYALTDIAKALGASGAVPTLLAAWVPPSAAVLLAAALLLHLEDG